MFFSSCSRQFAVSVLRGGAHVCVLTWVNTIFYRRKYTQTLQFIGVIAKKYFSTESRHFTLFYQFPFAVQTHSLLRSICRHLISQEIVQKHIHLDIIWHRIHDLFSHSTFMCLYVVLLALQKPRYLE